eukprot:2495879-Alexandrium_andersonii.AAC.1
MVATIKQAAAMLRLPLATASGAERWGATLSVAAVPSSSGPPASKSGASKLWLGTVLGPSF